MKIIVTGAKGFIGKNLCIMLREKGFNDIVEIDSETTKTELVKSIKRAGFIFHLAGVNRPNDESEFESGNTELTQFIVDCLKNLNKPIPLVFSSSIQAETDNAYGRSKLAAEKSILNYGLDSHAPYYIYRFPNVFGKWCRPNYNSFIATFCYNVLNNIDINIHDPDASVNLVYIDDVCDSLISLLSLENPSGYLSVNNSYETTVGEVANILKSFKDSRLNLVIENVGDGLTRALYSTYISYMSPEQFSYQIPSYADQRGIFCEMLKTRHSGQFSFFTAHPKVTRGGHYHHTKNEKFLVVKGKALFKFEHLISGERFEKQVSDSVLEIVETVPGWSHDITNIGDSELLVMLWANEIFDPEAPDTIAKPL